MLRVQIDGHDVETTPALLARLVFDGQVDRDSPATLPEGTAAQPLEQVVGSLHCEALTGELHRRLQRMCSMDSSAVGVQELCTQVERLCQWRWVHFPVAARFFWAAAWLHELADRSKNAIDFYDAFLLMPSGERHLRLLALNNRGVLQIRLGQLDGIEDLARAALSDFGYLISDSGWKESRGVNPPSALRPPQPRPLPAACFNLLNLINVSFGTADLLQTVDEELMDFFSRRPEDVQAWWLEGSETANGGFRITDCGPGSVGAGPHTCPSSESNHRVGFPNAKRSRLGSRLPLPAPSAIHNPPSNVLPILRDPTYRRLHALMARLSVQARRLATDAPGPMDRASSVFRRLSLWDCRVNRDPSDPESTGRHEERSGEGEYHRYGEAATLLLSDEIPSCLTRRENHPLARLESSAPQELAAIERDLALGQYDLAQSRLQVQHRMLSSLGGRTGVAALLAYVDAQRERMAPLQAQEEQRQLQRACATFLAEAEEYLRQNRPSDATVPVPESVYQALAQGRLHDPQSRIVDWDALEGQLDAHQAQYHTEQALSALGSGRVPTHDRSPVGAPRFSWDRVQDDLALALKCRPEQWLMVAPLFGLRAVVGDCGRGSVGAGPRACPSSEGNHRVWFGVPNAELGSHTRSIARGGPFPNAIFSRLGSWLPLPPPSEIRHLPLAMEQAGRLLESALQRIGADARKCLRLWHCVEETLWPVVAGREADALAGARALAERCLDHWPTGLAGEPGRADPRHPVNRFLEACEKARCLLEAEQYLGLRPPQLDQAEKHFAGVLRAGLDTGEQFRRVVTGLYLARFQEKDPPPRQRQVLAGLEAWAETVPPEAVAQMQERQIVEQTEKVRAAVGITDREVRL